MKSSWIQGLRQLCYVYVTGEGHAYLLVRSGVTSDGPVVANITSSFNDLSPAIKFEGHSGFYLQLLGNNTGKEYVSFTFTAFNPPEQGMWIPGERS